MPQQFLGWILLKTRHFNPSSIKLSSDTSVINIRSCEIDDYETSVKELNSAACLLRVSEQIYPRSTLFVGQNEAIYYAFNLENKSDGTAGGCLLLVCHSPCRRHRLLLEANTLINQFKQRPVVNIPVLKPRTKKILGLTALGLSTSEISNILHISNRGVDYHIEIAKQALKARNKADLTLRACKQGYLNDIISIGF